MEYATLSNGVIMPKLGFGVFQVPGDETARCVSDAVEVGYRHGQKGCNMEYATLSNGVIMPKLGFGVFQVPGDETARCVSDAVEVGYRHIDTAQSYMNESEVGQGIRDSGIDRSELFITTKVSSRRANRLSVLYGGWDWIIWIWSCCISHSPMYTVRGTHSKNSTRKARSGPSA